MPWNLAKRSDAKIFVLARDLGGQHGRPGLSNQAPGRYIEPMRKSTHRPAKDRTLGTDTYASMAKVEGLKLSRESAERLERTKGLSPEKRRAEVLRAYGADKPKRK